MNAEHNEKLKELILSNLESAQIITSKVMTFKMESLSNLQKKVFNVLTQELSNDYEVTLGPKVQVKNSSIWVRPKGWQYPQVYFGIEGFSSTGHKGKNLFYGLANAGEIAEKQSWERYRSFWAEISVLTDLKVENNCLQLDLSDGEILLKIIRDDHESEAIIKAICSNFIDFIRSYEEIVSNINLKIKLKNAI